MAGFKGVERLAGLHDAKPSRKPPNKGLHQSQCSVEEKERGSSNNRPSARLYMLEAVPYIEKEEASRSSLVLHRMGMNGSRQGSTEVGGRDAHRTNGFLTWVCLKLKACLFSMAENPDSVETTVLCNIEHVCDVVAAKIAARRDSSRNGRCLPIKRHPTAWQKELLRLKPSSKQASSSPSPFTKEHRFVVH